MNDNRENSLYHPERINVLDGLRAVAIMLVVAHHILYTMHNTGYYQVMSIAGSQHLAAFILNGWVGVHLFFVLSGFLITGQLMPLKNLAPSVERKEFILRYFKKRFFRIAPLYYLITTILLIGAIIRTLPQSIEHPTWWLGEYIKHLLFMNDYLISNLGYVLWSLAVEAKFYLISPFLILALLKFEFIQKYKLFLFIMLAYVLFKIPVVLYLTDIKSSFDFFVQVRSPFHMALDSLMAGVLCQLLWSEENVRNFLSKKHVARLLFTIGILLFVYLTAFIEPYFMIPVDDISFFAKIFYFPLVSLAFGCMLLGLLGKVDGYRIFESTILRGIAIISYSFYLIHAFLTVPSLYITEQIIGTGQPPILVWSLTYFIMACLITPLSVFLYYFIEKPFIDWSKRPAVKINAAPEQA